MADGFKIKMERAKEKFPVGMYLEIKYNMPIKRMR